ncbi:MAG: CoA transferase [Saprospiraceae bacterium]|nr:CoA transferase [Saprospiraceae bacterium]
MLEPSKSYSGIFDLETNRWELDFKTNADRVKQRDRLNIMLGQVFSEKSSQHWIDLFRKNGILGGKVKNLAEVLDEPGAKNMIIEEQMPSGVLSRRVKNIAFRVLS